MEFDYIVVGSGPTGCVLANRLSKDLTVSVLLIEAGGNDKKLEIKVPAGYGKLFYDQRVNWKFETEQIPGLDDRRDYWPKGKVLGGSSSINAMVYIRGQKEDFDSWGEVDCEWSWDKIFRSFKKHEDNSRGESLFHGVNGPISVSDFASDCHKLCEPFIESCNNIGIPLNADFNGREQEGVGTYQITTKNGTRSNAVMGYIKPITNRKNFKILLNTLVIRVCLEKGMATGVEILQRGTQQFIKCRKEVILSAGAINTPKLLQLSGIGPREILEKNHIPISIPLEGVGKNLQDHVNVSLQYETNIDSLNNELGSPIRRLFHGFRWILTKKGPLSLSINQAGGFIRSKPNLDSPDLQLFFLPLTATETGKVGNLASVPDNFPGCSIAVSPCRPRSRGEILIRSNNPKDAPYIQPNYFSDVADLQEMIDGVLLCRKIASTKPLSKFIIKSVGVHKDYSNDPKSIEKLIRKTAKTTYHPCGTCAMGISEKEHVVDGNLFVFGCSNLRVADSSIMPNIVSGNLVASAYMIGERAFDIIMKSR